jgi:hypothetical protein
MTGNPSTAGLRVAAWSGPRNISTALMRSWSNRPDTWVVDEPLYAYYLERTGVDHPVRDEVLAHHETDWRRVVSDLTGPIPGGRAIFYQKHMAHHLLPEIDRDWLPKLTHVFLIRDPREMLTSLIEHLPAPTLADTGLPQQVEIFESLRDEHGVTPPVIDSRDVLENPESMLRRLCAALGVRFTERMLTWPPGRRDTDGAWAGQWYGAVERSSGFQPYRPKNVALPPELAPLHEECLGPYRLLHEHRLLPGD